MSFWVEIVVARYARISSFEYEHVTNQNTSSEQSNGIVLDKDDYEVKNKADTIIGEIEKLNRLKQNGVITEEEFQKIKQDLLNNSFL